MISTLLTEEILQKTPLIISVAFENSRGEREPIVPPAGPIGQNTHTHTRWYIAVGLCGQGEVDTGSRMSGW